MAELFDEIVLPSGEVVAVGPLDRFNALCALLDDQGEQHWLAERLLEQDIEEIPEGSEDFVRIVFDMVMPARERSRKTTEEPQP